MKSKSYITYNSRESLKPRHGGGLQVGDVCLSAQSWVARHLEVTGRSDVNVLTATSPAGAFTLTVRF